MYNGYFAALENARAGQQISVDELLPQLVLNQQGLIPVITQCVSSGEVLMQAWMNIEALQLTLDTGQMTYWTRSRQQLWVKGATSGHIQKLVELRIDCDGDSLLCLVEQSGAACHTNRSSCYYFSVKPQQHQAEVLTDRPE